MPEMPAEYATIVILGASGDLTARKLIPALYALWQDRFLSERTLVVGCARTEKTDQQFRNEMLQSVREFGRKKPADQQDWERFARRLFYRRLDLTDAEQFRRLAEELERLEQAQQAAGNKRVVYMATAPQLFLPAVESMAQAGLIPDVESPRCLRVVFEKPFGYDLRSARELTHRLGRFLNEDQIYRIDHYLGKETVQNILLFRFGNSIFDPLLNRGQVDHIEITVAESQGIERGRGAYYDKAGALRDVLQNHVLQLLCLVAMEPPALFRSEEIRTEKLKVLQALAPADPKDFRNWAVAGQYTAGQIAGRPVRGYREEDRVDPTSRRETYVAMEVRVDNWRWAGVPFYLRTGKRLAERVTEIAIEFKPPPLHLFTTVECEGDMCDIVSARPNTLIFRIQPREAILLTCSTKRPGMQYQIHPVTMNFEYESAFPTALPEAYERLLMDVLRGDPTLFMRSDELEAAWRFVTPLLEFWESSGVQPEPYPAGSWGPEGAERLIRKSGRKWRRPTVSP